MIYNNDLSCHIAETNGCQGGHRIVESGDVRRISTRRGKVG